MSHSFNIGCDRVNLICSCLQSKTIFLIKKRKKYSHQGNVKYVVRACVRAKGHSFMRACVCVRV